jgi:hypothetical protein
LTVALQKRTTRRSRVLLVAHLEAGGQRQEVRVRDVSPAGALVEIVADFAIGETVHLHCGDTSAEGRLTWTDGSWHGIEFSEPLTSGALIDTAGSRLKVSAPRTYRFDRVSEEEEQVEVTPRIIRLRDRIR